MHIRHIVITMHHQLSIKAHTLTGEGSHLDQHQQPYLWGLICAGKSHPAAEAHTDDNMTMTVHLPCGQANRTEAC